MMKVIFCFMFLFAFLFAFPPGVKGCGICKTKQTLVEAASTMTFEQSVILEKQSFSFEPSVMPAEFKIKTINTNEMPLNHIAYIDTRKSCILRFTRAERPDSSFLYKPNIKSSVYFNSNKTGRICFYSKV